MASLAHRSKQRRAERAPLTAHGSINLVPLVDILTSIVFFSLLTYQGEVAALTAFDLSLPPQVITAAQAQSQGQLPQLNLLLAVRMEEGKLQVEHTGNGEAGFKQVITGYDSTALDQFEGLMSGIRQQYPNNSDVLVVPSDEVSYENIVHVMERLRLARFSGISLGNRARTVATGGGA
jgi:biopolymer transport protein ExbD